MALGCGGSRWLRAAASPFASMPPKPAGSWKAKALAYKAAAKAVLAKAAVAAKAKVAVGKAAGRAAAAAVAAKAAAAAVAAAPGLFVELPLEPACMCSRRPAVGEAVVVVALLFG